MSWVLELKEHLHLASPGLLLSTPSSLTITQIPCGLESIRLASCLITMHQIPYNSLYTYTSMLWYVNTKFLTNPPPAPTYALMHPKYHLVRTLGPSIGLRTAAQSLGPFPSVSPDPTPKGLKWEPKIGNPPKT